MQFQIGDTVRFGRPNGEKTLGKIVKIGRTGKYKIEQMEARGGHKLGAVWTVPPSLVYMTNGEKPAAAPKPPRSEDEIMEGFLDAYIGLSPENLSGDGELPRSSVQRKYRELQLELRALTKEFGRFVTETEAYDWADAKRAAARAAQPQRP